MATKTPNKDTILDLTVNMVPLAIILFFVVAFTFVNSLGFESLTSGLQYTLLIAPLVLLAALTCLSGKTIAGSEKEDTVYAPGRAAAPGVKSLHGGENEGATELEESPADDAVETADEMA